jgi:hypothetical protein
MTRADAEMDDYAKSMLSPLRPVPFADPKMVKEEKAKFLLQGENLRNNLNPSLVEKKLRRVDRYTERRRRWLALPIYKALFIVILVLVLLGASSFTVFAAQSSLPGDPLYPIKSVSEDIRISLAFSTQAKLNLTMDYTNQRVREIQGLATQGKSLPDQTSERYQHELEAELQLAAQMNDQAMQSALLQIKVHAENQGMTVEELIAHLPNQASPAILRLQERLQEQVQLSTIGEKNPQAFRQEIHEREHTHQAPNKQATSEAPASQDTEGAATPAYTLESPGNGMNQPTTQPGHGNPGNGNHNPNRSHTPKQ